MKDPINSEDKLLPRVQENKLDTVGIELVICRKHKSSSVHPTYFNSTEEESEKLYLYSHIHVRGLYYRYTQVRTTLYSKTILYTPNKSSCHLK